MGFSLEGSESAALPGCAFGLGALVFPAMVRGGKPAAAWGYFVFWVSFESLASSGSIHASEQWRAIIRREDPAEIYEVCEALGASLRGFWGFGRILSLGLVERKNRGKPRHWELAKVPVIEHSQLRAAMVSGSRDRGETVQKLP